MQQREPRCDSGRLLDESSKSLGDCISRSRDAATGVRVQADERTTGRVYRRALRTSLPVLQTGAPKMRSARIPAATTFRSARTRMRVRSDSSQQSRNIEGRFAHVNYAPDGYPGWRIRTWDHSSFSHRDHSISETGVRQGCDSGCRVAFPARYSHATAPLRPSISFRRLPGVQHEVFARRTGRDGIGKRDNVRTRRMR